MHKFKRPDLNMKLVLGVGATVAILASIAVLLSCMSHRLLGDILAISAASERDKQLLAARAETVGVTSAADTQSAQDFQAAQAAQGAQTGQGEQMILGPQLLPGTPVAMPRAPVPPLHPSTVGPSPGWQSADANPGNAGIVDVRLNSGSPPLDPWALAVGEPFQQVGYVFSKAGDTQMPLYARPTPYHRNGRKQYYVSTKEGHVQVSARVKDRDCAEQLGCEELYTGDTVSVPELGESELAVKLYAR